MSEQKQIEEWYEIIKYFTKDSEEFFDTDAMIKYIYSYYKWALSNLLDKEYADKDNENAEDRIYNLTLLASAKSCKKLSEELSLKYIHINVAKINSLLTKTQLSEDAIIANNNDLIQSFFDTEIMLSNLTYKDNPIETFQRFLKNNNMIFKKKNSSNYLFEFTFQDKKLKKNSYECNTIYEFLDYCSSFLLEKVNKELLADIKYSPDIIKTIPHESFDFSVADKLKNHDLFLYLDNIEYIRMNFALEDLYLLLYYDEIDDFKNKALMEQL